MIFINSDPPQLGIMGDEVVDRQISPDHPSQSLPLLSAPCRLFRGLSWSGSKFEFKDPRRHDGGLEVTSSSADGV